METELSSKNRQPLHRLVQDLQRLAVGPLTPAELDAGFALAIGYVARLATDSVTGDDRAEILAGKIWKPFAPTSDWQDFGHAISNFGVVLGTHALYEGEDPDVVSGYWYSAHAYLTGTTFSSRKDVRLVAAWAAVAYGNNLDWSMAGTRHVAS